MRIYDLIAKKRDGGTHSREELESIVNGYVSGEVADYQMAAWMMAVYLRGMTDEETAELTDVMAHSGVMVDLSPIPGIKVDKHSTGGVGDKTTLVIAPIVAACGVKIAKMSGRGLGHIGGTIDKMESVPGTRTALTQEEFFAQVNRIGLSVIGQSEGIAVADKKMYALRDVTATVSCIPLIASSIMSKKLASGSDAILLDVTTGTGAFMKTVDQSIELAKLMVSIGTHHGRRVAAMITDMDTPLGHNIGNSLEVMESMDVLKGRGPADLTEVCLQLAANMLVLAGKGTPAECRAMACGVKIAKMSGRGLGHTGGTIDKMESVPGTRTALTQEEFFAQVNRIGLSVIGQSEGIAVADKKMYALRDVTATVSCIPLIASSIMSKKLASGSDAILLDVTTGTGAFMKTVDQSIELAKLMVSIGTHHGRRVAAMITDMDTPLGHNIGNSLEVMESMDVLKGRGPADLTEVCLQLAANMLVLAGKGTPAECRAMAQAVIADGSAFAKCKEMFAAQGGDTRVLDDYSLFEQPAARYELLAEQDGYIVANDAEKIGSASVLLGAGRQKKGDPLDFAAGITLHKKRGDYVHKGESLATFYGAADKFEAAAAEYRSGLVYGAEKPEEAPLVYALVTKDGVERY